MSQVVASRYAKVFFEKASEKSELAGLEEDFDKIYEVLVGSQEQVRDKVLAAKRLTLDKKILILEALVKKKVNPVTVSFLKFLAYKGRLLLLEEVIFFFKEIKKESENILEVDLTKTSSLTREFDESLVKALEKKYQKKIKLNSLEDDAILGGFLIKVGDVLYDFSVRGKLDLYKKHLSKI